LRTLSDSWQGARCFLTAKLLGRLKQEINKSTNQQLAMFHTLLQAPAAGNGLLGMLFPLLIIVVFYFFLIRPQIKRQKEQQKFVESLKEGMEVVTNSGIIGRITKIDGPVIRLMVDEKTFIRIVKSSIQGEYKG
jgi:preprotein translocase subunit YajC